MTLRRWQGIGVDYGLASLGARYEGGAAALSYCQSKVDSADVETELVERLGSLLRVAGLVAWGQGGTYVSGEADLGGWVRGTPVRAAPVLRGRGRSRRG